MSEEFEELPFDDQEEEDPRSSSGKITMLFENTIGPNSRQEKLEVDLNTPVSEVKYTLSQLFSLASDEFHLVHAGMTCDADDIMANYNIADGDTLLLIPVTTAG